MKQANAIVVGSGISGLTATLILAQNGYRVRLVEKAPRIGGSLCRFRRAGVPFDTGFHFTGGLIESGLLHRMLSALGLADAIRPVFMAPARAHRFVFESEARAFDLPCGIAAWRAVLKAEFPGDCAAVDSYFDRIEKVRAQTASMDPLSIGAPSLRVDEDFVTLKAVLDALTGNRLLKAILCGLCMCHGVKPAEISFANHARVSYDLYESTARIDGGGEALIRAFEERLAGLNVEILRNRHIVACQDIRDQSVGRFVLDNGEELEADAAILTIHPRAILDMLPREHLSRAFAQRVESFEDTVGFFTVFGVLDGNGATPDGDRADASTILSLFPESDFNAMLEPSSSAEPALVLVRSVEATPAGPRLAVTAFEPAFACQMDHWTQSSVGRRPAAYDAYKTSRVEAIRRHVMQADPALGRRLRVLDSASMLTFRDYLHSPGGSAYGIKQKVGQFNLIGKLPLRNLFAAGQSSLLPGIAGAMMSSFIVARSVLGRDAFNRYMGQVS